MGRCPKPRDIYRDEHFVHLTASTNELTSITLYDALPHNVRSRLYGQSFCVIQYNASQTVPKFEESGYGTFNGERLQPGKIYDNFPSVVALNKVRLHLNHGGSYYVLAACTPQYAKGSLKPQPAPELWTIYTEGKDWSSLNLRDKNDNLVDYPYKINY